MAALRETGLDNLIVSGGVGANTRLREKLNAATKKKLCKVSYPRLEFCTDNGAMIAFAGAIRRLKKTCAAEPISMRVAEHMLLA